ncbi:MAG: hypothetical protein ACLTDC_01300 [Lachnospiraceae bacterium]
MCDNKNPIEEAVIAEFRSWFGEECKKASLSDASCFKGEHAQVHKIDVHLKKQQTVARDCYWMVFPSENPGIVWSNVYDSVFHRKTRPCMTNGTGE